MKVLGRKIFLLLSIILVSSFGLWLKVSADSQSQGVGIIMNVPSFCGNNNLESGEQCDGSDLGGATCISIGFNGGGTLTCSAGCTFNTSQCQAVCFLAGTKILLPNGLGKNIEEIKVGDKVLGKNLKLQNNLPAVVSKTFKHVANNYLVVNNNLKVTPNHLLFVNGEWQEASKLKIGDYLLNSQGEKIEVDSIKHFWEKVPVYNLEVVGLHNYYAENFLVHNKGEDHTPPTMAVVSTSTGQNTATIIWSAADSSGVATTSFSYGVVGANTSAPVVVLGNNQYKVNLSSLLSNTTYVFSISAIDDSASHNVGSLSGTFKTASDLPSDNSPVISQVASSTLETAAQVTWSAIDDHGLKAVSFAYGLTAAYGIPEPLTVSLDGKYSKSITVLAEDTLYYFKILVTDTVDQTAVATGTFRTKKENIPLVISSIQVHPGVSSAEISFNTNLAASSQVLYSKDTSYGGQADDNNFVLNRTIILPSLLPSTTYHYKLVATNQFGISTSTSGSTLVTLKDLVPPSDVSGLSLAIVNNNSFKLTWVNPPLVGDNVDFLGVKIVRKAGSTPANIDDGTLVYQGGDFSYTDITVTKNITYYYRVFSFDTSGNLSSGALVNGKISGPVEICNNGLDDDDNGKIDCDDSACVDYPACKKPKVEICDNGLDDDGNGKTDCADPVCVNFVGCQQQPKTEICNNGLDDDGDGKTDCADSDCSGSAFCAPKQEICNNGLDDDGDGQIDCADPVCFGVSYCQQPPKEPPPGSPGWVPGPPVATTSTVKLADLLFLAAGRKIVLSPLNGQVAGLAGMALSIAVDADKISTSSAILKIIIANEEHLLALDYSQKKYYADIIFSQIGVTDAYLIIDYGNLGTGVIKFKIESVAFGDIKGSGGSRLDKARITLYKKGGEQVDLSEFNQSNPYISGVNGIYGWMVLNGEYYLVAQKDGYYERRTNSFGVTNNIVNQNIDLIIKPPELKDVINPNAPISENVVQVAKNIVEKTKAVTQITAQKVVDTVKVVNEAVQNPEVQKTTRQVVVPAAISVATVSSLSLITFSDVLPFLRLLFLQPLLLLGKRKRQKWGQIYNSLDKQPVDLAIVRLVNADDNRLVQSKVTDKDGRYAFVVEPGKYKIEVQKLNFVFPSTLLKEYKNDGKRIDIYHGEMIEVSESNAVITANVPVDLEGVHDRPRRLIWDRWSRGLQKILSLLGLLVTVFSLYYSPVWYVWMLLAVHVILSLGFRRLAKPLKVKGWGIVYDSIDSQPIGQVVARLFNAQFNKLVSSQFTDRKGRYYFLAGDDRYYVTFAHPKYLPEKTEVMDLSGKKADAIAVDVSLKPSSKDGGQSIGDPVKEKELDSGLSHELANERAQESSAPAPKPPESDKLDDYEDNIYG